MDMALITRTSKQIRLNYACHLKQELAEAICYTTDVFLPI